MAAFLTFFEDLMAYGLEYFGKYYGVYRGIVEDNKDPEKRGRVKVHVPAAGQSRAPDIWVDPAFPAAGKNRGFFWPPEIGDAVRVSFAQGDPSRPTIYWGGWYGTSDLPSEFDYSSDIPETRGFITRGGHKLVFNDTPGSESVEITWHKPSSTPSDRSDTPPRTGDQCFLKFTDSGVVLENKDGSKVEIVNGKITIDAAQVEIASGADQQAVRGNELFQWLLTHQHGSAVGPTSPPITPIPPTVLSVNTKVK